MVKYSKQLNKTDCGPMAVLNALKWAGYPVSCRRGYKSIKKNCKWKAGQGTYYSDIYKTLQKYSKLKSRIIKSPKLKELDSLLEKGYTFILLYTHKHGRCSHFIFCSGKSSKKYFFKNDSSVYTNRARVRKTINSYLRKSLRKDGIYAPARVICIKKTKNNPPFPFKNI